GIISGLLLVFILSLGFFVTPAVLGGPDAVPFVVLVERYMNQLLNWPLASTLSITLLIPTLLLYLVLRRYLGVGTHGSRPGVGASVLYRVIAFIDLLGRPLRALLSRTARGRHRLATRPRSGASPATTSFALMISAAVAFPIALVVLLAFVTTPTIQLSPDTFS